MASDFIKFSFVNIIGGIMYVLRIPERFGFCARWRISNYALHFGIVLAAIFYGNKIIEAFETSDLPTAAECQSWKL
jgi:predicted membrane channel-forming protein YqfA (hemolysin III family)